MERQNRPAVAERALDECDEKRPIHLYNGGICVTAGKWEMWRERIGLLVYWLNSLLEKGFKEADVATGC